MDSTVSQPNPAKIRKPGQFDREKAKALVAKAWKLRRERKAQGLTTGFVRLPAPLPTFETLQLGNTRARIAKVYEQLEAEQDPDLSFKLGCLLKKLWEIYQLLAQLPGPGTLKPRQDKPSGRRQASDATIEYD